MRRLRRAEKLKVMSEPRIARMTRMAAVFEPPITPNPPIAGHPRHPRNPRLKSWYGRGGNNEASHLL